ncbi:hypothetical protein VTN00DRAFT_3214 [Thermoascus crustaceus]|uniref:uncharacterized protein n=1 Tax=Thermoascus crustaceus TaxID=5088 RepID=UPI00374374DF
MLNMGLRHGDCVGIVAGNCYQYIEVFLGGARIGCPVVVLSTAYMPEELRSAVVRSSCKLIFVSPTIGTRSLSAHIDMLLGDSRPTNPALPELRRVVSLGDVTSFSNAGKGIEFQSYSEFVQEANSIFMNNPAFLRRAQNKVKPGDVLNLQFTSGGYYRTAQSGNAYTHVRPPFHNHKGTSYKPADDHPSSNLINDGRFVGHALRLTPSDVVCCPPPLFHCFGLVMGFLASFCHGSSIVFPSDHFDARRTLDAVVQEKATALLGVPTMFVAELEVLKTTPYQIDTLRTGLAAGSPVPAVLMDKIHERMGVQEGLLIAYGMTETSPVTFITSLDDPKEKKTTTLGKVLPHTAAKVVDSRGNILPRGERGEICTSGFALQKGYWGDEGKTKEAMRTDEEGRVWMHTGDEGFIDEEGYGHITGRIKDLIIRGGENIPPTEIEDRLIAHPSISEACVVGLEDRKYGEVVGAFLKLAASDATAKRPADDEVRGWVTEKLGRHKAPQYVFWIGDPGVGDDYAKTGSGKYQKHVMRERGNALVKSGAVKAKL